jgi:F-type H+/Na+-transporting ATPase subunit alpha
MKIKSTDLVSLFEDALRQQPGRSLEEVGIVLQVGDNICMISGLEHAIYNEVISFEGGNKGIVFNLDEDFVSVFLLYNHIPVAEREIAKRTGDVFKVPVGMELVGRVIDATGRPLDELGDLNCAAYWSVEASAPGVMAREPINSPLQTGQLVIDALVPIGRGQRELIIGNRNTGKTSVAVDTILNQKDKQVFCVYVSIGQRQASVARLVQRLQQNGGMEYSVIVNAQASDPVLNHYLAPYVGCTIAEYFREQGYDALVVYDDLTNHAVAYREMSLLLRRSPGREAFPGDIFYLHSRLLERAGLLLKGGSVTALPIVQIQNDDITAYIPTNLISITDGQIFLDTKLFKRGVRPAVNVELSVSRVGGAAQTSAVKKMAKSLRLELAQYHDLLDFAQFGTELDELSQQRLARGERAVELLKQDQHHTYTFVDQTLILFLLRENFLDNLPVPKVRSFALQFVSYVMALYAEVYNRIDTSQDILDEDIQQLRNIAQEFIKVWS